MQTAQTMQTVERLVQGTADPRDPLLPVVSTRVEIVDPVPEEALVRATEGEVVDVPVRMRWWIERVDSEHREATDVVTLRRDVHGWTRLSPARLPWGLTDPMAQTSPRCRIVGSDQEAALVQAVHESCERAVGAVSDVWPGWREAAVVVLSPGAFDSGTAARVEGSVRPGSPASADRVVMSAAAAATLAPEGLDIVLRHELVHIAMRATGAGPVPLWLEEGLAVHVGYTGVADDRSEQPAELRRLHARRAGGGWPGAVPDETAFTDPSSREDAYVAARVAVEVMMTAVGRERLLRTAADASGRAGPRPTTDAQRTEWFLTALGRSPDWLEREWGRELDRRVSALSTSR